MTALPIVTRELRIIARRSSTYWTRIVIAATACLIGGYLLRFMAEANTGPFAKQILYSLISSVLGIYALFSGIRNTADNISSEKREGTLGLLFLTDLKGYDVVLGKLCSAAINSLYGMLAAFPILGIALIGGGITGNEFLRGSLALLNVIFFAHALGLAISVYSINSRRALGTGIFIGFVLMWGVPILTSVLALQHWTKTAGWLVQLSPLNALHMGVATTPAASGALILTGGLAPFVIVTTFWRSLFFSHMMGWFFLLIACWQVPRSWQNVDIKLNWRARLQHRWYGPAPSRALFRSKLIAVNPFFWLASRARFDPVLTALWLMLAAALVLTLFIKTGIGPMPLAITLMIVLHLIVRVNIASSASRHFAEQRRSGALEFLLACTPLDTPDIIRGQWLALRRQFLIPLILIVLLDLFFVVVVAMSEASGNTNIAKDELAVFITFSTSMILMLIGDSVALGWVGMWMGISYKRPNRASSAAISRVIVWPVMAMFFIAPQVGFAHGSVYVVLALWFCIGILWDAFLIVHAKRSLYAKFRTLAATPYEESTGMLHIIGRAFGKTIAQAQAGGRGEAPPVIR